MKRKKMDIKKTGGNARISAVICTFLVVVVAIVSFLGLQSSKGFEKRVVDQALEQLRTIARTESQHTETRINNACGELGVLAENPKVKEALLGGLTDENGPLADSYSAEKLVYEHLANDISSLYRLDNKGIVQSRFPWKKGKAGNDYSLKPGVSEVLKNQRPYISKIFKTNSGVDCISVCYPVFEENQLIGVLRALIKLDIIRACLKDSDIGQKGYAWILADDGTIISHSDSKYVGLNIIAAMEKANPSGDWTALQSIVGKMVQGEKGVGFFYSVSTEEGEKIKDVKKLTAFVPIRMANARWSLGGNTGI